MRLIFTLGVITPLWGAGCDDSGSEPRGVADAGDGDGVDSGEVVNADDAAAGDPDAAPPEPPADSKYVVSSVLFNPDNSATTYVSVLDSLAPQEIDYAQAVEIAGWGDVWAHDGHVYISSGDGPTITKYAVTSAGALAQAGEPISFLAYETDAKFWSNTFVAPDKAYMIHGVGGYVIWNPQTMEITGSMDLPVLPEHPPFLLRSGTLDRSNVIRDGKLYQPMYWSDLDYAVFSPDSRIVVIDIATDTVEGVMDAPCAGLDVGTIDAAGNVYFSTWTGGIYQPLVVDGPDNCVIKVAAGADTASADFTFTGIAEGREGAAVRHFRDARLLLSVFHSERVDLLTAEDPWAAIGDLNWRTWLYDPASASAAPVDAIDWNSGATYIFPLDGEHYVMLPAKDYVATSVSVLHEDLTTSSAFELRGWGMRMFKVR